MTTILDREALTAEVLLHFDGLLKRRFKRLCGSAFARDVSLPQMQVLATLQDRGSMTVSELANSFSVSPPSASAIIDRMEERGLVRRTRSDTDRRVVTVEISQHGQTIVQEFAGLRESQTKQLLQVMTEGELQTCLDAALALEAAVERLQA